jgi:hypothetical protein
MAKGIRRIGAERGGGMSCISFVILYQIRLFRARRFSRLEPAAAPGDPLAGVTMK